LANISLLSLSNPTKLLFIPSFYYFGERERGEKKENNYLLGEREKIGEKAPYHHSLLVLSLVH
jgi:hypothetical protein